MTTPTPVSLAMDIGTSPSAIAEQNFLQSKLKSIQCPAPLQPSAANPQIRYVNSQVQLQTNAMQSLLDQINDLEKRYMVQFAVGNVNVYTPNTLNAQASLSVTGAIPNPKLNFTLLSPNTGRQGASGPQGPHGSDGRPGAPGSQGVQGYWGVQGSPYTS